MQRRCQHCGEPYEGETLCGQDLTNFTGEVMPCPLRTCPKCMTTLTGPERHELGRLLRAGKRILLEAPRPQREWFDNETAFARANDWYNENIVPLWQRTERLAQRYDSLLFD